MIAAKDGTGLIMYVHYHNGFIYHKSDLNWWRVGAWKPGHQSQYLMPHIASPLMQQLLNKFVVKNTSGLC